jgi:hypothetical protein
MSSLSPLIHKNRVFLIQLAATKEPALFIKNAKPNQMFALIEIAYNILRGRLWLRDAAIKALTPFAIFLRKLASTRSAAKAKKLITELRNSNPLKILLSPVVKILTK